MNNTPFNPSSIGSAGPSNSANPVDQSMEFNSTRMAEFKRMADEQIVLSLTTGQQQQATNMAHAVAQYMKSLGKSVKEMAA